MGMSSWPQRVVPVNLIAGKEYVLRNGRHVTVIDNPHWQCAAKYPFVCIQGPDYIRYFTPSGEADPAGGEHEDDIIRPVYKLEETYLSRDPDLLPVTLTLDDGHDCYPLEDDARSCSWTRDGRMVGAAPNPGDLMDYAPQGQAPALVDKSDEEDADPWIGKRVRFDQDGGKGEGVVVFKHDESGYGYAVEIDEKCAGPWHTCEGHVANGRGWWVLASHLSIIDEDTWVPAKATVATEEPRFPDAPSDTYSENVGKRVTYPDRGPGVIKGVSPDRTCYAVEFDNHFSGGWGCHGLCASGQGWFIGVLDSELVFDEPRTAPATEPSAGLSPEGVAAVWKAYLAAIRYGRSELSIEKIIADWKQVSP